MATSSAVSAPSTEMSWPRQEISDSDFITILVNEDICCPSCYRPFFACDLREVKEFGLKEHDPTSYNYDIPLERFNEVIKSIPEGFVIPLRLNCNHAMCVDCARHFYEPDVVFLGSGVRCQFHKCDQLGGEKCVCNFLTPCKDVNKISVSAENMLIAHALRNVIPIVLGTKDPKYAKNEQFFYYFKTCHYCQKQSEVICTDCNLPACEACFKEHHTGHKNQSVAEYEKTKIQSHKCVKCKKNQAFKYCAICKLFLCRNRNTCFDPCMDPDHLLIEFDPSLVEIKRFEYNAVDNSRKMFVHDAHDYLETDPFMWQAADMESIGRTMYYQEKNRCNKMKTVSEDEEEEKRKEEKRKEEEESKKLGDLMKSLEI